MIDSGKEDQSSLVPTRYRFSSQDTPNFPLQVDLFAWRGGSENVAILSSHYGHSVQLSAKSLGLCSDGQRMYILDQDGSLSMKDFFDSRRNSNEGPAVYTQKLSHFDTESYSKQSKNIPVCIHRSHLLALTPNSKGTHYQLLYGDLYDLEHTMESFDTPYPYDGTSLRASAMVAQQGILHVYYPALQQLHCLLISDILEHSGQETEPINRAQQQAIREGSTARVVDCSGLAKQGSTFQMLCMHAPENPSEGIWLLATTGIAHFKFDDSVNHGELKIVWERQPIPEDRNDKLPDEAIKSLVSVSTCGHAHLCWMDPMSDVTSRCSLYAVSNGTLRSLGTLDHPEVQNHEKGIVTLGCFAVPPTSSSVQRANEAYECAICFDEIPSTKIPNLEVVCLDCGHIFHEECLQHCLEAANSIRTSGKHITFNLVKCCVCSTFIRHPKLHNAIAMINIRKKMHVDAVARHQANMGHRYFVLENTTGAANPPVTVGDKKKPHEIIEDLKMYYYLCSRCGDPFFGGSHSCAEGLNEVPVNPSLLVCTRCDVDQHCPTHGTEGMMDQCSYCCNPAPHHIRFGRFPVCEVCTASKNAKVAASCKGPGLCAFGGSPTTCRIQAYGLSSTASTHTSDSDTINSKRVFSQCMLCPNGKLDFAHMSYPEKINQDS